MKIANIDFGGCSLWQANKILRDGVFSQTEVWALARGQYNATVRQIIDGRDGSYKLQMSAK